MKIAAGIDFGTSNSSVSYVSNNRIPKLLELERGKNYMPTALFFPEHREHVIYGSGAIKAFSDREPGRFMRSIKRILGSSLMNSGTEVNSRLVRFDKIICHFIRHLKEKLDYHVGKGVDEVVMGRPVYFRDNSQEEDIQAQSQLEKIAREAGFKNVEFQFEPIAAAFAHERMIEGEKLACVVDIGGGTSDFTVIRIGNSLQGKAERKSDILANTGVRIGGNDFDKNLSLYGVMPELGKGSSYGLKNLVAPSFIYAELSEWSNINFTYTDKNIRMVREILEQSHDAAKYSRLLCLLEQERGHELLQSVEEMKIGLSMSQSVYKVLACVKDSPEVDVTQKKFGEYIKVNMEGIKKSLKECLRLAKVRPENIEIAILTGGSTEVPAVKKTVGKILCDSTFFEGNKLSSVGEGLAYDAKRRFGF